MGASKKNPTAITTSGAGCFPTDFISKCEQSLCVDWAVAFSRITAWPVHVVHVNKKPIRAYAEDDGEWIFDINGMMRATDFSARIVEPLTKQVTWGEDDFAIVQGQQALKVAFACCGEEGLDRYGLTIDDEAVSHCEATIRSNSAYLSLVPQRPKPWYPADQLSKYSWGGCAVFAEALGRVAGLPPATMLPLEHEREVIGVEGEGFHTVVQHPDGRVEDVWGVNSPEHVAKRYGMRIDQ